MYNKNIEKHLLDYLALKSININKQIPSMPKINCLFCDGKMTANILKPYYDTIKCVKCSKKATLIDIVKQIEKNKVEYNENQIYQYIIELLQIDINIKADDERIEELLSFYEKNHFDLVPIGVICPFCNGKGCTKCDNTGNYGKNPVEKDWTDPNKHHCNKNEWHGWIDADLNLGVKCGKISKITVIDFDAREIPTDILNLLGNTLVQKTKNGWHYFYKYDDSIPKTRIDEYRIDIENDGGQVVIEPSKTSNYFRKFINLNDIITMPDELKNFLNKKVTIPLKTQSETIAEEIISENFKLDLIKSGNRTMTLMRIGGLLRKHLSLTQTQYALSILNRNFCIESLNSKEFQNICNSLDKYCKFDEKELAHKIIDYLRLEGLAGKGELEYAILGNRAVGEHKTRITKALSYLSEQELILRTGRGYKILKKVDWDDSVIDIGIPVDFDVPYFYKIAHFYYADMLLIGANTKVGKTHICMNMIKSIVNQGKKPYYISLESGSRCKKIALQLGLKDGDFYSPKENNIFDPLEIELENNAITFVDWLDPSEDFTKVNMWMKHFLRLLKKTHGFLVVFVQLREDNNLWFAKNLIKQYPALAARYIYKEDTNGEFGSFHVDAIRDPKGHLKTCEISCKYIWQTKELKMLDDLEENKDNRIKEDEIL